MFAKRPEGTIRRDGVLPYAMRPGAHLVALPLIGAFALLMLASVLTGAPPSDRLPAVSFQWLPLFHLERVMATLGLLAAALLIGWRATNGVPPVKLGNVEYELDGAIKSTADLDRRVRRLEFLTGMRGNGAVEGPDDGA